MNYQKAVLNDIITTGKKFALDRGVIIRLAPVGAISDSNTVTTQEVVKGNEPLFFVFSQEETTCGDTQNTTYYPKIMPNKISFPKFASDGSGMTEGNNKILLPLINSFKPIENWSSELELASNCSRIAADPQDNSLLFLPEDYILVLAGDKALYETRVTTGRPAIFYESYLVMQLDLAGVDFSSEIYQDVKIKYVTSCNIADRWLREDMGTEKYFDCIFRNRETKIYEPYYRKFMI